jgi:hypothetical protein
MEVPEYLWVCVCVCVYVHVSGFVGKLTIICKSHNEDEVENDVGHSRHNLSEVFDGRICL